MNENLERYRTYLINTKRSLVYYNYVKPLCAYLEEKQLQFETITKEQLAQFFTDKEYSENSINTLLNSCRDYCKFLNLENHACKEIKQVQPVQKEKEFLDMNEIDEA